MKNLLFVMSMCGLMLFSSCYTEIREGAPHRRHWGWRHRRPVNKIIIRSSIDKHVENPLLPENAYAVR